MMTIKLIFPGLGNHLVTLILYTILYLDTIKLNQHLLIVISVNRRTNMNVIIYHLEFTLQSNSTFFTIHKMEKKVTRTQWSQFIGLGSESIP